MQQLARGLAALWLAAFSAAVLAQARELPDFTRLVEEGLRAVLERDDQATVADPLPAYGDPDATVLIDLGDRDAVWAALDADGPA